MSGEKYVPISQKAFVETMDEMGFVHVPDTSAWEMIFKRPVTTSKGVEHPYYLKIYSSVDERYGVTRQVGADAIRVVLFDKVTDRPLKKADRRVYRTKNALPNLKERARELFKYALVEPRCPNCGAITMVRKGAFGTFRGCSRYEPGKPWHCEGKIKEA